MKHLTTINFKNKSRCLVKMAVILFSSILMRSNLQAQISPPGLSDTRLATWMAIGLNQTLDQKKSWESMTYIGHGFMSNPHNPYHLFERPSMFIINEEVKKRLTEHISITGALSYREQYLYNKERPYHKADPNLKKEFRLYAKLAYGWKVGITKWNLDFRPEYRRFFLPEFDGDDTRNALRVRFKLKSTVPLSKDQQHFLILSAESLFQNERSKPEGTTKWTGFLYDDSRFAAYYRYAPKNWPIYAEVGYMNNLTGKNPVYSAHHLGIDVVFKDIF